jgi:hypothetical protein
MSRLCHAHIAVRFVHRVRQVSYIKGHRVTETPATSCVTKDANDISNKGVRGVLSQVLYYVLVR